MFNYSLPLESAKKKGAIHPVIYQWTPFLKSPSFSFFAAPCSMQDLSSWTRGWTWAVAVKLRTLTPGPPGNSLAFLFNWERSLGATCSLKETFLVASLQGHVTVPCGSAPSILPPVQFCSLSPETHLSGVNPWKIPGKVQKLPSK